MKTCTKCKKSKPLSDFSFRNDKPRSHCKSCASVGSILSQKLRRTNDPEGYRASKRESKRKQTYRRYGLEPEEVEVLGDFQDWCCYICNKDISRRFYVDHNHVTGQIRRLLCLNCNVGLGHFRDSIVLLSRAIRYLEEYED